MAVALHGSTLGGGVGEQAGPDFFISFTSADATWAKWIATELEKAGHTTVSQVQDFRPGHDFVHEMHRAVTSARRTIAVLSPEYLDSEFGEAEWRVAFANDPSGHLGKLVPVKVRACQPPGLLRARVHVDLVDADEETARRRLLDGVGPAGRGPVSTTRTDPAPFPGTRAATAARGRRRVLAALVAGIVLLVAVTTSTAWALSSAASLSGRQSAAGEVTPTAAPTEEVVAAAVPTPPGDPPAGVFGAGPALRAAPAVGQPSEEQPVDVRPQPPRVPLEITTERLPSITLGESWSVTFKARGGVAPYEWSIVDGAAPEGLVLQPSGRLSGKAKAPGRATFTIAVEDERGERATRTLVLSVPQPSPPEPDPLPGDINRDGAVDCADMDILRSDWGKTGSNLRSDLNADGTVGSTDMSIMLSHWTGEPNSTC